MGEIIFKDESYAIIGGCMAVYRDKGAGFLEPVYQECRKIEFEHLRLAAVAKPRLELAYRGKPLKHGYEPDSVCFGDV